MNYLTEKQLQALPTPRLLALYRKRKIELSKAIHYNHQRQELVFHSQTQMEHKTTPVDDPDLKVMEDYVALVKTILNTREHVPE